MNCKTSLIFLVKKNKALLYFKKEVKISRYRNYNILLQRRDNVDEDFF